MSERSELPVSTGRSAPITPVLLVNFIGSLGLSIVIPFLVFLVRRWGGDAIVYGLLASTYPALQLLGAPLLGRWSDRIGRRKVLLLSQLGTFLSWLIFAAAFFVPESTWLVAGGLSLTIPLLIVFVARGLDGLTGGNISVANAYLSDISTDENRDRNFGWMAMSANAGFVIGPALAGVLGATPYRELVPVLAAALISLVALLIIGFFLPESNPCVFEDDHQDEVLQRTFGQQPQDCIEAAKPIRWHLVLREPGVLLMLGLYLLIFLAFSLFYTAFPNHAVVGLGWDVVATGWFFTILSALMVLVQGPVRDRLARHLASSSLVVFGGLIMAGSFGLMLVTSSSAAYGAAVLFALGNGLMWPSFMTLLSRTGQPQMQGSIQGLAGGMGGLASIVGLITGGLLYSSIRELTFAISALIIAAAALLATSLAGIFPPAYPAGSAKNPKEADQSSHSQQPPVSESPPVSEPPVFRDNPQGPSVDSVTG